MTMRATTAPRDPCGERPKLALIRSNHILAVFKEYLSFVIGIPFDRIQTSGFYANLDHDVNAYNTREIIVNRACLISYEPCVKLAKELFAELKTSCSAEHQLLSDIECNQVPIYMRQYIYAAAIEHGDQHDFEFLLRKWEKEHYMLERDRIWYGIMWMALLKNRARESFKHRAIQCSKKLTHESLLMDLLMDNKQLMDEMEFEDAYYMLTLAIRQLSTTEQIARLDTFLKSLGPPGKRWAGQRAQTLNRMHWKNTTAADVAGNASLAIAEMRRMHVVVL
uniref:ERAP1_C domain-containing protein n=1 Tax=Caenorhabditis japonica TaxID=281687 RepID=A0A8R1HIV7_CAEJA